MTKREMIIAAINFEKTDKVPHNITFTQQTLDKMNAFAGCSNYYDVVDNHIAECYPDKPQVEIRPGFFKDEYCVVRDKTGVDKDIGMVEEYILESTDPVPNSTFFLTYVTPGTKPLVSFPCKAVPEQPPSEATFVQI